MTTPDATLREALEAMVKRYRRLDNGFCTGCGTYIQDCQPDCPQYQAHAALASQPRVLVDEVVEVCQLGSHSAYLREQGLSSTDKVRVIVVEAL